MSHVYNFCKGCLFVVRIDRPGYNIDPRLLHFDLPELTITVDSAVSCPISNDDVVFSAKSAELQKKEEEMAELKEIYENRLLQLKVKAPAIHANS